jgi:hypothetical protein
MEAARSDGPDCGGKAQEISRTALAPGDKNISASLSSEEKIGNWADKYSE